MPADCLKVTLSGRMAELVAGTRQAKRLLERYAAADPRMYEAERASQARFVGPLPAAAWHGSVLLGAAPGDEWFRQRRQDSG